MLTEWKASPDSSHDDLFIERYDRLLSWSLRLTDNNHDLAVDLVHDAFIQFTFTRPDLNAIHNLDNYLYGMLRNLRLSQVRRGARNRLQPLSIVEYDSIEASLRALDPRDQIQVQEELRRACHYACIRKDTSKVASVLILRFFHGYYPSEIVQVIHSSHDVVRQCLRVARAEIKLYLDDPKALRLLGPAGEASNLETFPTTYARATGDFLNELRRLIFQSRQGDCLTRTHVEALYAATRTEAINCQTLAHLVACEDCLDQVNHLLGLPQLSKRHPTDTIGQERQDRRKPGGPGGGSTVGGSGMQGPESKYHRWKRDVFEHDPQELCVSVNGYLEGSQKISSALSELTLSIKDDEKISFVEVFSEQDVRLLLLNVDDLPPNGSPEQTTRVELSQNRTLELTLRFRSPFPTIHVTYRDPSITSEVGIDSLETGSRTSIQAGSQRSEVTIKPTDGAGLWARSRAWLGSIRWIPNWRFFFRPATATVILGVLLVAAFLFTTMRGPVGPPSASDLLNRSMVAEEADAARIDQVLHRTISFEEKTTAGVVLAQRKIEVWHSAERGLTARRLYDERGTLIAGQWTRADGVRTIYHHGSRPQLQLQSEKRDAASLTFENVWLLDPSAKEFAALIARIDDARVETRDVDYLISYGQPGSANEHGLLKASLVLGRADLRPLEQTLTVKQENEVREYYFKEASFERHAPKSVAPAVFEPDPELLVPAAVSVNKKSDSSKDLALIAPAAAPVLATAELEVEALQLLNKAGADINDETTVTRTAEGKLRISGLVESDQRRADIVRALAPINRNPAVVIEIETVTEAVSRQRSTASSGPAKVQRIEVTRGEIPVYADLKRYFGTGQTDSQTDEPIRQFAASILNRSRRAMSHAGALKRLAGRFSEDDRRSLSPEARAKWLAVIRSHARAFEQEYRTLRQELQPIFRMEATGRDASDATEITDDASLTRAIERLLQIGSANDEVIRAAFSISSAGSTSTAIRSPQFWRDLKSAEGLAANIQDSRF